MRHETNITKLLQSVTKVYYKVRLVLQSVTDCYYKVCQVLQSVTGCYYKVPPVLQSATVITKWDATLCIFENLIFSWKSNHQSDNHVISNALLLTILCY